MATVRLHTALATPVMLAEKYQTTYLKVGLTGLPLPLPHVAPVNLAIVIDKSNSMLGTKIQQAKEAAKQVVDQLREDDVIALIGCDHHVEVLLPATKASEKETIYAAINQLTAKGNTALFSGIERGVKELRKFASPDRVNRILLVSDGHANVGPSSPEELAVLGAELGDEGIAVTTIGLGLDYHEDLMTQLAKYSGGNHAFAEHPTDLVQLFHQEFGDMLSIVAQHLTVTILCRQGCRPIRVLGRETAIQGNQVVVQLNQLYTQQEKSIILELVLSPQAATPQCTLAEITVSYHNVATASLDGLSGVAVATFTTTPPQSDPHRHSPIMATVAEQLALEKSKLAVTLRDSGRVAEARELLLENAAFLKEQAAEYESLALEQLKDLNILDAQHLEKTDWKKQRKVMRVEQHRREQ